MKGRAVAEWSSGVGVGGRTNATKIQFPFGAASSRKKDSITTTSPTRCRANRARLIRHVAHRRQSVTSMDIPAMNRHESERRERRTRSQVQLGSTGAPDETCKCNLSYCGLFIHFHFVLHFVLLTRRALNTLTVNTRITNIRGRKLDKEAHIQTC